MESTAPSIVFTLTELIQANIDRSVYYKTLINDTLSDELKQVFKKYSAQSETFINELAKEVIYYGGNPVKADAKAGKKLLNLLFNFKHQFSNSNTKSQLKASELQECLIVKAYEEIMLNSLVIPQNIRKTIVNQFEQLKESMNSIKNTLPGSLSLS